MSKERIVSYTAEELAKMRERGESRSDWAKVKAMTEEELEASIAADPGSDIPPEAWENVIIGLPDFIEPKKHINLRVDMDVWRWFKGQGKGYQTRMNAVLRSYMLAQRHQEHRRDTH
jgi:uncharacterized protein (DUF4415 family)